MKLVVRSRQEQKEVLYADYGKLKKQVKQYDVIQRNIDKYFTAGQTAGVWQGNRAGITPFVIEIFK